MCCSAFIQGGVSRRLYRQFEILGLFDMDCKIVVGLCHVACVVGMISAFVIAGKFRKINQSVSSLHLDI